MNIDGELMKFNNWRLRHGAACSISPEQALGMTNCTLLPGFTLVDANASAGSANAGASADAGAGASADASAGVEGGGESELEVLEEGKFSYDDWSGRRLGFRSGG